MLTLKNFKEETNEFGTYLVMEKDGFRLVLQPCMSGFCIGLHKDDKPVRANLCTSQTKETFQDDIKIMQLTLELANDIWENRYDQE